MNFRLSGTITSFGEPVLGARVNLVGDLAALSSDPRAVVDLPAAVTWTRVVTGWSGNLWNAWQRFVARDVAGIAWEDFRALALRCGASMVVSEMVASGDMLRARPEARARAELGIEERRTVIQLAGRDPARPIDQFKDGSRDRPRGDEPDQQCGRQRGEGCKRQLAPLLMQMLHDVGGRA